MFVFYQISMDGPNVNWKFLRLFKQSQSETTRTEMIEIGSCGLHIIHGSFQTGHKSAGWSINETLRGIYNLFKDSPKRRIDFITLTKCNQFPKKFCTTRWVESADAANRALEIIGYIETYVNDKNTKLPTTFSVKNVKLALKDKLLKPKLAFFATIAEFLETFLKKYQTDKPMVPFLYNDLEYIIRTLTKRFVLVGVSQLEIKKLIKIDLNSKEILKKASDIDVGFNTKKFLSAKQIGGKEKILFLKECQTFLISMVKRLLERCCLKYPIVAAFSSLDPGFIKNHRQEETESKFENLLQILHNVNIMEASKAEKAKTEFSKYISEYTTEINSFSDDIRLDKFYFQALGENKSYENLWHIIKLVLILSHGNATVESGFSINKNLLIENLQEKTLISQRIVYDSVKKLGGVENVEINGKLRRYATNSYHEYKKALEENRSKNLEISEAEKLKRKAHREILQLETKKRRLEENAKYESETLESRINSLRKYI